MRLTGSITQALSLLENKYLNEIRAMPAEEASENLINTISMTPIRGLGIDTPYRKALYDAIERKYNFKKKQNG